MPSRVFAFSFRFFFFFFFFFCLCCLVAGLSLRYFVFRWIGVSFFFFFFFFFFMKYQVLYILPKRSQHRIRQSKTQNVEDCVTSNVKGPGRNIISGTQHFRCDKRSNLPLIAQQAISLLAWACCHTKKSTLAKIFTEKTSKSAKYHPPLRYKKRPVKITMHLGLDIIIKLKFTIDFERCAILNVLNHLTKNFVSW